MAKKNTPVYHTDTAEALPCAITGYMHCARCLAEFQAGIGEDGAPIPRSWAPRDYARTQTGITLTGLQVWCSRHDCNIVSITLGGV